MQKDISTLDMLKNTSKTIGGVIGIEHAMHQKLGIKAGIEEEFFHEGMDLRLEDITFN